MLNYLCPYRPDPSTKSATAATVSTAQQMPDPADFEGSDGRIVRPEVQPCDAEARKSKPVAPAGIPRRRRRPHPGKPCTPECTPLQLVSEL